MDGGARVAIVTDDVTSPAGLVADLAEKRLYFVDPGSHTIGSVTYDGQDRVEIYEEAGAQFLDVTISGVSINVSWFERWMD